MRRTDKTDLSNIEISTVDLPSAGEIVLRDSVAHGLALRLRASGARTWVMFSRGGAKTIRRTLGDANLIPLGAARRMATDLSRTSPALATEDREKRPFGEDVRIADLMPHFLASGKNGRWKPEGGQLGPEGARVACPSRLRSGACVSHGKGWCLRRIGLGVPQAERDRSFSPFTAYPNARSHRTSNFHPRLRHAILNPPAISSRLGPRF